MPDLKVALEFPQALVTELRSLITEACRQAATAVNAALTLLYWRVGDRIRRSVLSSERAGYGEQISATIPHQLVAEFGRGLRTYEFDAHDEVRRGFPGPGDCRDAVTTIELDAFKGADLATACCQYGVIDV